MILKIFGSTVVVLKADKPEELFPNKVYEQAIRQFMHPDNKFIDHPLTRGGKICTTDRNPEMSVDTIPGSEVLFAFLKKSVLDYAYLYFDKPVKDAKFVNSWANLMFQGCEIKSHNDRNNTTERSLMITYYPKAPPGSSNLVFLRNSKGGEWASETPEEDMVRLVVEDGTMVIFDNLAYHAVDPHGLTSPRMCIATEYKFEF